ncbi:SMC-Scp complex subunit ScpB [Candidatus Kaiserbacteria bacterium]|nr:SMC-Scp complex subunit ScpB [Candidatus Kaiserbacteria bacterium]USN92030.1 MAG: SMC-Scp complex subunit ScpB [Candidatus Nomurabacteria bacterium]
MSLDVLIEALLFYKVAPQNKKKLLKLFDVNNEELSTAIAVLKARLEVGATRLIETETEIQLTTASELSEFVETLRRQDLTGDIGKAGAETLAIILYREPIARVEIDRIRGVNSSFILRNLLTRGLIIRESITGNGFQFRISPALLQHLGVSNKHELPQFSEFMNVIDTFDTTET